MKSTNQCTEDCIFFHYRAFQDMGASMDLCELADDIWDFLENKPTQEKCPNFIDRKDAIKHLKKLIKEKRK